MTDVIADRLAVFGLTLGGGDHARVGRYAFDGRIECLAREHLWPVHPATASLMKRREGLPPEPCASAESVACGHHQDRVISTRLARALAISQNSAWSTMEVSPRHDHI